MNLSILDGKLSSYTEKLSKTPGLKSVSADTIDRKEIIFAVPF